ncbi:ribonuclease H-like domain-containing protein [Ilyonectria destructans]|nr:ribonuclease H-like domain-containing protein [Ilyonectria destructans]
MDDSDSDDDMGPVELPSGRLICRPHGLVVCGRCCVDYSFMDEVLEDSDEAAERESQELYNQLSPESRAEIDARWGPPSRTPSVSFDPTGDIRRGIGRVLPTKFVPPSPVCTPNSLFPLGISRQAIPAFLMYTDGACLNNGQANPKAGWAYIFRPASTTPAGIISGRLENKGPFGGEHGQTSNHAELQAILAVLHFRHWVGKGFSTLVFATDSEYVAKGATEWARGWNKDLWEMLLGEAERWHDRGLGIQFWRIPRELNVEADHAAKEAADNENVGRYLEVKGVLC